VGGPGFSLMLDDLEAINWDCGQSDDLTLVRIPEGELIGHRRPMLPGG
jgi:hypothetical protein